MNGRNLFRRPGLTALAAFVLVLSALVLSACGGGGSSTSSESSSTPSATESESSSSESAESGEEASSAEAPKEEEASGEPIVTQTYADVNTEGPPFKNIEETARVYEEWVNAHGGIGGRPLEVQFCDGRGTSTGSAACAREAVANEVVAVVGSFSYGGDAITPVLEKGNTALFGNCCTVSAAELVSPISYPIGNAPTWAAGLVNRAVEEGCEHINSVLVEGAESFEPVIAGAAEQLGTKIGKFVTLPAVAQDYTPQVAEAESGEADCIIMVVSESNYPAWMPAFAQSGKTPRLYGPQGNFNEKSTKGFESLVAGDIVGGVYPDIHSKAWEEFRNALVTYKAEPELDYNSLAGLGTWAAYEAFKQIVEGMKGEINHDTFIEALQTAKVELPGKIPPIDFGKPWSKDGGPESLARLMSRCGVLSEFNESGELVPLSEEFEDNSELAGGTKPEDCGPPFEKG
jgi:ABC-type branched-subunit amino acid transport system substrate-binding protein